MSGLLSFLALAEKGGPRGLGGDVGLTALALSLEGGGGAAGPRRLQCPLLHTGQIML